MSYKIIPLGMRCQAVEVASTYISQPRYPFDWCQMNIDSMCSIISLQKNNVEEYFRKYFSEVDVTTKRHKYTDSWFPHDNIESDVDMEETIQKYIRRTYRLLDAIHTTEVPIVFIIFFSFPYADNYKILTQLITTVSNISHATLSFFVVNCDNLSREESDIFYIYEEADKTKGDAAFTELGVRVSVSFKKYMERFSRIVSS
jgi:hypothetical protein